MFGLGEKTFELMRVLGTVALTREQCDQVCRNGIVRLEFLRYVKQCPHCKRYELDHKRLPKSVMENHNVEK